MPAVACSHSVRTAAYLRCYPYDRWQMEAHRGALCRYAERIGFPEPAVFLDNGCRFDDPRPALETLVGLVARGSFQAVLIPGPFVFALDDDQASSVARQFDDAGCLLLELPPLGAKTGGR